MPEPLERLFICYMPALDARWIQAHGCPFIASLFADYPSAMVRTLPTIDHVPTLLTGTWPHQHGLWGPRLKANGAVPSPGAAFVDLMPDLVDDDRAGFGPPHERPGRARDHAAAPPPPLRPDALQVHQIFRAREGGHAAQRPRPGFPAIGRASGS